MEKSVLRSFFLLILLISSCSVKRSLNSFEDNVFITANITIRSDTSWSGNIFVSGSVLVTDGATLRILPGTRLYFKNGGSHYQDTTGPGTFSVINGRILAIGKSDSMIWFSSSASVPINGDWPGIFLLRADSSVFDHVIVEFGMVGIYFAKTKDLQIRNSIVRWSNIEGIYGEESNPLIEYNTLYANAYHEIALENYNYDVKIRNNIFGPGHDALIFHNSTASVENNCFKSHYRDYISVVNTSTVSIKDNKFDTTDNSIVNVFRVTSESVVDTSGNTFYGKDIPLPVFDYPILVDKSLNYIPGDTTDKFKYVYDSEDITRTVVKRMGKGLGFSWDICFALGHLWMFKKTYLVRIDTANGNVDLFYGRDPQMLNDSIMGPRCLAWDGRYFWAGDNGRHRVLKLQLILPDSFALVYSFRSPNPDLAAACEFAVDSAYIYMIDSDASKLLVMDTLGNVVDTIIAKNQQFSIPMTKADNSFWCIGVGKGIGKFGADGVYEGSIYGVAHGPTAITWDGEYLWTMQKTCELWNDDKIFKIKPNTLLP